jgi:hypothetical protein
VFGAILGLLRGGEAFINRRDELEQRRRRQEIEDEELERRRRGEERTEEEFQQEQARQRPTGFAGELEEIASFEGSTAPTRTDTLPARPELLGDQFGASETDANDFKNQMILQSFGGIPGDQNVNFLGPAEPRTLEVEGFGPIRNERFAADNAERQLVEALMRTGRARSPEEALLIARGMGPEEPDQPKTLQALAVERLGPNATPEEIAELNQQFAERPPGSLGSALTRQALEDAETPGEITDEEAARIRQQTRPHFQPTAGGGTALTPRQQAENRAFELFQEGFSIDEVRAETGGAVPLRTLATIENAATRRVPGAGTVERQQILRIYGTPDPLRAGGIQERAFRLLLRGMGNEEVWLELSATGLTPEEDEAIFEYLLLEPVGAQDGEGTTEEALRQQAAGGGG